VRNAINPSESDTAPWKMERRRGSVENVGNSWISR
jgi:hypothetical protein